MYVRIKTDLIVPLSQSAVCPEHTHSRSLELGTEAVDDSIKADKDSNDTTITALEKPSSLIFRDSRIANFWALVHFCTLFCHFHRGFREFMVVVNHSLKQFCDTCIQKSIKMNDLKKGQVKCFFNCLIFCHPSSFKCRWGCAYKSWRYLTKTITAFLQCWTWSKSPTRKKCHKKFRQSFRPSSSCKKIWILKKNESFLHSFTFSSDFEVSIDSLR